ncbi:MAG: hypothetical protein ABII82_00925 [Verrucomicrobiota bacterium]
MKMPSTLTKSQIALALTLIALRPAFAADPAVGSAETKATKAEAVADDYKASLDQINASIDAIEQRVENAPDGAERSSAEARLDALKERRSELRKNYVKAKADELAADLKVEYAKVAAWTKDTYRDVKAKVTGDAQDDQPGAMPKTQAALDAEANKAMARIAVYKMNPSPENKADVKRALDALDDEIERLDDHCDAMPDSPRRAALEKRVDALEDRHDDLANDFTKARWDALVADLRGSWESLVN